MDAEAMAKGCSQTFYRDSDGDSYGSIRKIRIACSAPAGYVAQAGDCDDSDASRSPGATEVCDGIDQDCNRVIDDNASDAPEWHPDRDHDGHGDASQAVRSCQAMNAMVRSDDDCDDNSPTIYTGATEICDNKDNDCDGQVDVGAIDALTWYADADQDGYGLTSASAESCSAPSGYTLVPGDCNDGNSEVSPGAAEVCNTLDDNCDGQVDVNATDATAWYADVDRDGHGDPGSVQMACAPIPGMQYLGDDCNDTSPEVAPGLPERCDGRDNNCDGITDRNAVDARTWYADADQDGFGDPSNSVTECAQPHNYARNALDCDDSNMGEPLYVDLSGTEVGAGTLADPMNSIQSAVDAAARCIVVGGGTYAENLLLDGYQGSIRSLNGSSDVVVQGAGEGATLTIRNSAVELEGLTVTGGGPGAWQYADLASGQCVGLRESLGGGMNIEASTVSMTDINLLNNDISEAVGPAERTECLLSAESMGGGIYALSSMLTLNQVTMQGNNALVGAALSLENSSVALVEVQVLGQPGSAVLTDIDSEGGSLVASNLLMLGNADTAIYASGALSLSQTLVAGYETGMDSQDASTLVNSILVGNGTALTGSGAWTVQYTDSYGNQVNWPAGASAGVDGNISADPLLSRWSDDQDGTNDKASLSAGSPAIDAGMPGTWDTDGSVADMGVYGGSQN